MAGEGRDWIASVVEAGEAKLFLKHGTVRHMLRETEVPVYDFVDGFVRKYGALPSRAVVEDKTGDTLPKGGGDPPDYLFDQVRLRWLDRELRDAVEDARAHMKPGAKDPDAALTLLRDRTLALSRSTAGSHQFDLREAAPVVMGEYALAKRASIGGETTHMVPFGWPTLDQMTGGMMGGDLVSVVGRPQQGKTWYLLWMALRAWEAGVGPVAFFSMEMRAEVILQRLVSLLARLDPRRVRLGMLGDAGEKRMVKALTTAAKHDHPFLVVDGNLTSTVPDLVATVQQLGASAAYVDGAYMLQHDNFRLNRFERVAENTSLLKRDLAAGCDIPVVASWQYSKKAADKAKKNENPDIEDIGLSDVIPQMSSVVIGLFQKDTAETVKYKRMDILKGRNGERGVLYSKWNFSKVDFSEVSEPSEGVDGKMKA